MIAALVVGWQVVAFANLAGSPFQGNDGDLADNTPTGATGIDWNSYASPTGIPWTNTPAANAAPYRLSDQTTSGRTNPAADGWRLVAKEDEQKSSKDTGFAGGTKQDTDCATVKGSSAPNKDDLKRTYLSTKVLGGDTFLNLAWVRIPQNTTSASAHVGFEFNQGSTPCGGSGGLVERTAGDLLFVYDFEGSSTDNPTLSVRKWVNTAGATCEVGSNSPTPDGCWSTATSLSSNASEAKVNTFGSVSDALAPPAGTGGGASTTQTLGTNEFGEASINLSDALPDVFGPGECTTFGKAEVISRSSGNSEQASMEDLVGPVNFNLSNCGSIKIIKQTNPRGLNKAFNFTSDIAGPDLSCTSDTTPAAFDLNDNGNTGKTQGSTDPAQNSTGNTETCTGVPAGTFTVTEPDNPNNTTGFTLADITCTPAGSATTSTTNRNAIITIGAGSSVTCVFTNSQNKQSILNTDQGFIPNDTATITGTGITSGGSVNFQLIQGALDAGETCADEPTGTGDTLVYQADVAVTGTTTLTASTNNTGGNQNNSNTADGYTIIDGASEGAYYWRVSYSDGAGGNPDVISCNEVSNLTINDGTEVRNPESI